MLWPCPSHGGSLRSGTPVETGGLGTAYSCPSTPETSSRRPAGAGRAAPERINMTDDRAEPLRRMANEAGLIETPDAVATSYAIRIGALPPDTRSLNERCGIHLHSINPMRKRIIPGSSEYACAFCLSAPQRGKYVVRIWLGMALETRRLLIIGNLGIDPVTQEAEPIEVALTVFKSDLLGNLSMQTDTTHALMGGGLPNGYWHAAIERGWLARESEVVPGRCPSTGQRGTTVNPGNPARVQDGPKGRHTERNSAPEVVNDRYRNNHSGLWRSNLPAPGPAQIINLLVSGAPFANSLTRQPTTNSSGLAYRQPDRLGMVEGWPRYPKSTWPIRTTSPSWRRSPDC